MRSEMNCIKAFRMHGDNNPSHIGHRILLPASFIGSPRDMIQQYQDAMALLRAGKPDLFITMTCNPNWMEIQAGQKAQDQPDITETGSSYAYILVILHPEDKSQTPDGYDDIVCAEIPDPVINPRVHATIIDSMFHGPCGMLNPNAPCMVDDVMGARSFEELRVVDGIACAIFKESAQHRVFGDVSDVHQLWIENFDAMVEDFAHNEIPEGQLQILAVLQSLNIFLQRHSKTVADYDLPELLFENNVWELPRTLMEELSYSIKCSTNFV
ncbi:11503_t:CDS:2 [Entrophospora sp. SA101]|nr:11503_t:CDS:2 [Entrophospora sp. SA101]